MSSWTVPCSSPKNENEPDPNLIYSLRDHDVLSGRGKAANDRRGNMAFRRDVENSKVEYFFARKHEKIHVARRIVALVHERGGRFVKINGYVNNQETYVEIDHQRALDKAGQALRERCCMNRKNGRHPEKLDDRVASAASGSPEVVSAPKSDRVAKTENISEREIMAPNVKICSKENALDQSGGASSFDDSLEEEQWAQFDDAEPPPAKIDNKSQGADDEMIDTGTSSCPDSYPNAYFKEASKKRAPVHRLMMNRPSATNFVTSSSWLIDYFVHETHWEEMFLAVADFKEVNGHCAIPPSSCSPHSGSLPEERAQARLADWASVQRHIFREAQQGRRVATDKEKDNFARLQRIGFVFDYEAFHWTQRYEELIGFQQHESSREGTGADQSATKRENVKTHFAKCLRLAMWAKQQHQLYAAGPRSIQTMSDDRIRKFGSIDISRAAKLQTKRIGTSAKSAAAFAAVLAGTPGQKRTIPTGKKPVVSTTNSDASIALDILEKPFDEIRPKSADCTTGKALNDSVEVIDAGEENVKAIANATARDGPDATSKVVDGSGIDHTCRSPDSAKQTAAPSNANFHHAHAKAKISSRATVSPEMQIPDAGKPEE